MAETNAVDPGGSVGAAGPGSGAMLDRTSVAGGGVGINPAAASVSDGQDARNLDALLKLGNQILQPHIKAAQQAQFMEGMKRAAQGEALNDILDSQPWYTQIFGPSSASMGARAFTTQESISKFGAEMTRQMPNLIKQGPEALTKAAQESMQQHLSGDPLVDAAVMASYAEQLGPLMKQHATQSYIYGQKVAAEAQVRSWDAAFDNFQQVAAAAGNPEGGVSPADVDASFSNVLAALVPFGDQGDESYFNGVMTAVAGAAGKGNFHIINRLEQAGALKDLPPDDQAKLQQHFRAAGQRAVAEAMPHFALDVAMFVNDTAQDPRQIVARSAALNKRVSDFTGVPLKYAQAVPNNSLDNIVGNVLRAQASVQPQGLTRDQEIALATPLLTAPGGIAVAASTGMVKDTVAEEAALRQWTSMKDPAQRAALLNARGDGKYDAIKATMQANLAYNATELSDGFRQTAATYAGMSESAKGAYFSADQTKVLDRYNAGLSSGMTPEQSWVNAKVFTPLVSSVIPEKDVKDYRASMRKAVEDKYETWYGRNEVTDGSLRVLEAFTNKDYTENRGLQDVSTSATRALSAVTASGRVEVVGKHAIINSTPGAPSILAAMQKGEGNKGAKEVAEAFDFVLRAKARNAGMDLDKTNYTVTRAKNVDGKFRFVLDLGGEVTNFMTITEEELRAHKRVAARDPGRLHMPPPKTTPVLRFN